MTDYAVLELDLLARGPGRMALALRSAPGSGARSIGFPILRWRRASNFRSPSPVDDPLWLANDLNITARVANGVLVELEALLTYKSEFRLPKVGPFVPIPSAAAVGAALGSLPVLPAEIGAGVLAGGSALFAWGGSSAGAAAGLGSAEATGAFLPVAGAVEGAASYLSQKLGNFGANFPTV